MEVFKYHPDNIIYKNQVFVSSYTTFMEQNSNFPLEENNFCVLHDDGKFETINTDGHHIDADVEQNTVLIAAINSYLQE